ncbi:hypothetical protein L9F63_009165, partial [Diploptera punctata]
MDQLLKDVEGNIEFKHLGAQRFWPFDSSKIRNLSTEIQQFVKDHKDGKDFRHMKFWTSETSIYGFPTVMGLPGVYTQHSPSLLRANGNLQITTVPDITQDKGFIPNKMDANLKTEAVYAAKLESKLSIITPFNYQRHTAGVNRKLQLYLPLQMKIQVVINQTQESNRLCSLKAQITPLDNIDHKLVQFSSVPFTTIHQIDHLKPDSEDKEFKVLHVQPTKQFDAQYGQSVGQMVNLKYEYDDNSMDVTLI